MPRPLSHRLSHCVLAPPAACLEAVRGTVWRVAEANVLRTIGCRTEGCLLEGCVCAMPIVNVGWLGISYATVMPVGQTSWRGELRGLSGRSWQMGGLRFGSWRHLLDG